MKNLMNLVNHDDVRVYVYLDSAETTQKFIENAEAAGMTFNDGAPIRSRQIENIMALNADNTINFVGTNGHIAFGSDAKEIGGKRLVRLDYAKYLATGDFYLYRKENT